MKCPSCDTWVDDDATVCWLCKAPIGVAPGLQPPAAPPPVDPLVFAPRRRSRRGLGNALLAIAIAIVVGCAGFGVWWLTRETGERAVDAYVADNKGVEFTSHEGGFRATYPTDPERVTEDFEVENLELTSEGVEDRPGTDYLFAVSWIDVDVDVPGLLRAAPQAVATAIDGTVEQMHARQVGDIDATEALVESDEQVTWALVFQVDSRVYVIEVGSKSGERAPFDRLVESFELLPAES